MNVLVTGSSGFVGKNLTRHLKNNQLTVLGLDMELSGNAVFWNADSAPTQEQVVEFLSKYGLDGFIKYRLGSHENDITRESIISKLQGVDVIIHLASQSHVDRSISGPKQFVEDNVMGTLELFEMARELPNLKKIILFSTDETVACLEEGAAKENQVMHCGSVYSASKGAQELLAQAYIKTHNLPIIITRCVNIFGPEQAHEKFLPKLIEALKTDTEMPIYGNGSQSRQWVHVDHISDVLNWLALNTIIPDGTILHITGTEEIRNIVMANAVAGIMGKKPKLKHVEDRLGHDVRYALDKGDAEMVWDMPSYKLKDSFYKDLETTINWYMKPVEG